MRIGDVSRARRFANPARIRWYAFHRSVRFALRMMKREDELPRTEPLNSLPCVELPMEENRQLNLPTETPPN